MAWSVFVGGAWQSASSDELREWIQQGRVDPQTIVRHETWSQPSALGQVQQFAGTFPKVETLGDKDVHVVEQASQVTDRAARSPLRATRWLGKLASLANIERKVLFSFTRAAALVVIGLLTVGVLLGVIATWRAYGAPASGDVSYDDIKTKLSEPRGERTTLGEEDVLFGWPGPGMSPAVRGVFAGKENETNRAFLARRLSAVDPPARQDYLDNLAALIDKAAAQRIDIIGVANAYTELKPSALKKKKTDEVEREESLRNLVIGTTAGAGLIALFTLVLVLLAIERNTRPARPGDKATQ